MGNFRPDNRSRGFGRKSFGGRGGDFRRGGDRDFERPERRRTFEKHEVTCDKCGKLCDVPFKPTTGKPIYCRECFGSSGSDSGSNRSNSSEQFDQINEKLNKIMKALEIE